MLKLNTNKDKFFHCYCANWTSVIKAKTPQSAASKALIEGLDKNGLDIEVSPVMMVKEIKKDYSDNGDFFAIDKVFDDIGMYEKAEQLREILEL
jgi:hypothetical protein|tara:strand:+ start:533 stop:814 length:282 start_codon:yes stop_codon:yes gene_type:complete